MPVSSGARLLRSRSSGRLKISSDLLKRIQQPKGGAAVTKGRGGCELLEMPHPALAIFPCNEPTYYRGGAGITGGGP
jgi:hypothetical protein